MRERKGEREREREREKEGKRNRDSEGRENTVLREKSSLDQSATRIREPNTKPEREIYREIDRIM